MTDEQIIKALECCPNHEECYRCECEEFCGDLGDLSAYTLYLINRLKTENAVLIEENKQLKAESNRISADYSELTAKRVEQSDEPGIIYCTDCEYSEVDATHKIPRLICTKCKDRKIDYNRFCSDAKRRE